jgi:molybdate transport system substrate-binding protein
VIGRAVGGLLLASVVAGCMGFTGDPTAPPASSAQPQPTARPVSLTIFAAASLKAALEQARAAYEIANPGSTLTISTDSSAALEVEIEQGAPADVFLSADTTNPAKLVAAGLASGKPVTFAANTLVIIVAPGNPGGVASAFDLAKPGLKLVAAGDEVPITTYATELVENLAALPGAPAGFAASYAANVVSREDNVRAVVAKIELGEGDAAIVYASDARSARDTSAINIPAAANVAATYAGVIVKASANQAAAAAFLSWLTGPDGQAILATFGFLPPPE